MVPGKITGHPGLIKRKFRIALDLTNPMHSSAQVELRVAKLLRSEGENVFLIDNELHRGASGPGVSNDFTLLNSQTQADVKRLSGIGRNAAKDIAKGVRQVGLHGLVIVVRGSESANTFEQFQQFISGFVSTDPTVTIRLVDENALPRLGGL